MLGRLFGPRPARPASDRMELLAEIIIGDPDPIRSAIEAAVLAAAAAGNLAVEIAMDGEQTRTRAIAAPTSPAQACPVCHQRPIRPGATALLGEGGTLITTCLPCSTQAHAVDAVLRHAEPMREDWTR